MIPSIKTNMGMQDLVEAIYAETEEEIRAINEKVNEWAKIVLYTLAMPQIKGEITKNKLIWRGIKLTCVHNNWGKCSTTYVITQRGKVLGSYEMDYEYK